MRKYIIFIVGMHRSGTSALARCLHLQGVVLPTTLMAAQSDNPDGFWESRPVVQLNDTLLGSAGRPWYDPGPIPSSWWDQRGKKLHRIHTMRDLLKKEFPEDGITEGALLALKDPRISRLLPIWRDACDGTAFSPCALICCRNPIEVADSLRIRNSIGYEHAQLLWLTYMLEAEHGTRGLPRAIVCFDDLLKDWRRVLAASFDLLDTDALEYAGPAASATDGFLCESKRHNRATTDDVLADNRLSALVKDTYVAFRTEPHDSLPRFDRLRARLSVAWNTLAPSGKLPTIVVPSSVSPKAPDAPALTTPQATSTVSHRNIILHYHLFKNAGTSIDHILKQNFHDGWHEYEGAGAGWRSEDVGEYLRQHPEVVVLSSHTALLPPPILEEATVFPVIFLRHPIDRIRSIYEFERKQIANTLGACMAKQTDLAGYVRWRLHRKGDRSIRNFQCYRLAFFMSVSSDGNSSTEEARAMAALETLPFLGLVERFDESLTKLQDWLAGAFPTISLLPIKANVTQKDETPLEGRLSAVRESLGEDLYEDLLTSNELDMEVYRTMCFRYGLPNGQ